MSSRGKSFRGAIRAFDERGPLALPAEAAQSRRLAKPAKPRVPRSLHFEFLRCIYWYLSTTRSVGLLKWAYVRLIPRLPARSCPPFLELVGLTASTKLALSQCQLLTVPEAISRMSEQTVVCHISRFYELDRSQRARYYHQSHTSGRRRYPSQCWCCPEFERSHQEYGNSLRYSCLRRDVLEMLAK